MKTLKLIDFENRTGLNIQRKDGLILFDYGKEIQYSFDWDEISLKARGIVFDETTGELVANPYAKFFNYEELVGNAEKLPVSYHPNFNGDFMCLEKADGSCGIVYFYNNEWRVNTRGSFESEQAVWAKSFLDKNVHTDLMNPSWTYLFEIIYPENRIVVDYGRLQTLRLTGIIVTATGEELWIDELRTEADKIGCEVVEAFEFSSLEEMFAARENLTVNEEGYVITYKNGYKFKLKGEIYCNVHRAISHMTPLSFWRAFDYADTMKVPREFLELMPEEFRGVVDAYTEATENAHLSLYNKAINIIDNLPIFEDSREGKKARYQWISSNVSKDCTADVLGIISSRELGNGNDWKVRESIHRRARPTCNSFNGIELDPRLKRMIEEM